MGKNISVVINTLNEENSIARALNAVKWADEIVVCDMHSEDKTVEIAKKLGAKVVFYKRTDYVEPARNFAISKVSNEWVLVLDPDEEIPDSLKDRLIEIVSRLEQIDYVRIPRKNIIFSKWMKGAMWWPDYNIRFFKKGSVQWTDEIHRPPKTEGQGLDLPAEEELAIIHRNYQTISQFITRMNRYTTVEVNQLIKQNYQFKWSDLIEKPLSEFLSRFFAGKGYQDGLHGLTLSFLQAFSFLIVYLKLWEMSGFKQQEITLDELEGERIKSVRSLEYWMRQSESNGSFFKNFLQKFKAKLC